MARRFTADEISWFVANYKQYGPTQIARMTGRKVDAVKSYAHMLRDGFVRKGDDRWKLLDSRGNMHEGRARKEQRLELEPIKHYRPVTVRTLIEGKYGLCPPWLVITDPAFDKTTNDI